MKKTKTISFLLACAMLVALLSACGSNPQPAATAASDPTAAPAQTATPTEAPAPAEPTAEPLPEPAEPVTIRIGVPTAPPALPVLHMIEDNLLGDNVTIELDVWNAPEQLIAMVQGGEHNMFAFPLTVVGKLYNNGVPVRLMNVNTWGVTYFVTTDPEFQTWADLAGKTVYVPMQSSPPDALTQYFLNEAGLTPGEDVELIYASTAEIGQMMASGQIEYATLIEPQVTVAMTQNPDVIRALSFEDEWKRTTGTDTMIPNAGFGALKPFIDNHPELAAAFQSAYEESVQWVLEHPQEAGALAETYLGMKGPMVAKAIPNMGLHFKSAGDARDELDTFYNLLNDFDPTMIGGKLPDDGLYYAD